MTCECHNKVKKMAEEKYGKTYDWDFVFRTNKDLMDTVQCGSLTFTYHPLKTDGTLSKRTKTGNFLFTYCPFCGKPILED